MPRAASVPRKLSKHSLSRIQLRLYSVSYELAIGVLRQEEAAFLADSRHCLTINWDGKGELWDLAAGRPVKAVEPSGGGRVNGLAVSADGKQVLTAGEDKVIWLWKVSGAEKP